MLIDLFVKGLNCLVIGGGEIGERKSLQLLDSGALITVLSKDFTNNLMKLETAKKITLKKAIVTEDFIKQIDFKPWVVIVALDDHVLNKRISEKARSNGFLVSVVDDPLISDFAIPAVSKIGKIRIGISTQGNSPAMAGIIRKKVEKLITKEDLLHVELQSYARSLAKKYIKTQEERKELLLGLINNKEITKLLKNNRFNDARLLTKEIINKRKEKMS